MAGPFDNTNPKLADAMRAMVAESQGRITIVSGYRSPARQGELWANALIKYGSPEKAREWVAPPGKSNHNHGEAFDLGGDLQLAHQLAPKYGIHFPMNGQNGKGLEPWHAELMEYESSPDAYTIAPPQEDTTHIDKLFGQLREVMNGTYTDPTEQSQNGVAEFDASKAGEFSTTAATNEFDPTQAAEQGPAATPTTTTPTSSGVDGIDSFMKSIATQESGGNYNARNATSGAAGKYQIMPANWGPWSKEAGLTSGAPMTAENQERVARFKIEQYYKQFGNWTDVSKAWYGGPGSVKKNGDASQGAYPTINEYANKVTSRMGG